MACPRPRVSGRFAYMPSTYLRWRKTAKALIRKQCQIRDITEPVFIVMSFVFQRPKTMMRKKDPIKRIIRVTKPDIDNLCKSVMDTLQDCKIIKDDSQVVGITAHKWYGAIIGDKKSERNSIKIDIYPLKR